MLIGPPKPARDVEMSSTLDSGVPAGNMAASRGSARLHGGAHVLVVASGLLMTTGGKLWSCGAVLVECRCLKAVMLAIGSSWLMLTTSEPGIDPREVMLVHFTLWPAPKILTASSCMLSQVSGEA